MGFTMQMDGLREFAENLRQAAGDGLKEDLRIAVNAVAMEFLRIVQMEIRACKSVVTALMINSFGKGGTDNIWDESDGGLTIEVGSGVKYARWVNDGHHKTSAGVKGRWVSGKHFWEAALRHSEPAFDRMMQNVLDRWIAKYF